MQAIEWLATLLTKRSRRIPAMSGTVQLRVETLEDRMCPSYTISVSDGILHIVGDRSNNTISLVDHGDGTLHVLLETGVSYDFSDLSCFEVKTGAGDDRVTYETVLNVTREPFAPKYYCGHVDMYEGVDFFEYRDMGRTTRANGGTSLMTVEGGQGRDTFTTIVEGSSDPSALPCLGTALNLIYDGGADNDTFIDNFSNVDLDEPVSISRNGGGGADTFDTRLQNVAIDAPVVFNNLGGAGNDVMDARIFPAAVPDKTATKREGVELHNYGGIGSDDIAVSIRGFLGNVVALASGGDGSDRIDVEVDLCAFNPETGHVTVAVDGGADADYLQLRILGVRQPPENTQFFLGGGTGEDFAVVSAGVTVRNVEYVVID